MGVFLIIFGVLLNNAFFSDNIHSGFYFQEFRKTKYVTEEIDLEEIQKNYQNGNGKNGSTLGSLLGASVASLNAPPQESYGGGQGGIEEETGFTTLYGNALLVARSPVTTITSANNRNSITTYTVQEGDNPTLIAASFGITINTLLWANKLNSWSIIRPGNALIILPVSGVSHKVVSRDTVSSIAKKYKAEEARVMEFNALPADGALKIGDILIIPDGEIYVPRQVYVSAPGYLSNLKTVDGYFIVPATGRNWGRIHPNNAVDIANSCGTPIYAAAAGAVLISDGIGWNGGYGKYIKIQHSNGTDSLYAHNSQNLVSSGETISQGQLIALIGTTGRSTGCHLHFEVHGARNPFVR